MCRLLHLHPIHWCLSLSVITVAFQNGKQLVSRECFSCSFGFWFWFFLGEGGDPKLFGFVLQWPNNSKSEFYIFSGYFGVFVVVGFFVLFCCCCLFVCSGGGWFWFGFYFFWVREIPADFLFLEFKLLWWGFAGEI